MVASPASVIDLHSGAPMDRRADIEFKQNRIATFLHETKHDGLLVIGEQSPVGCAELGHRPVQRPGAAVEHIGIAGTGELPQRECREHELRVNAKRVEHP